MSHPGGLPDLFLDRSLGRKKVPELVRADGLRLVTLAEHYGVPHDETIQDTEWLQLCGEREWLALMQDTASATSEPDDTRWSRSASELPSSPTPIPV